MYIEIQKKYAKYNVDNKPYDDIYNRMINNIEVDNKVIITI